MLLDTSGLFAYLDEDDLFNARAVELLAAANYLLTHDYVLAELIPLCYTRGISRAKTLAFVGEILESPLIEKIWTTEQTYRAALSLLKAREDKGYSLCDAVSFVVMREKQISEALTTDKHFEQEGFTRLLK